MMAYGFSASELILLCQSVYKLCIRVKKARPEFAKLTDTVDDVQCTLEYLLQHADISSPADPNDEAAIRAQNRLERIAESCVSTLKDMRKVLDKYSKHLACLTTTNEQEPEPLGKRKRAAAVVVKCLRRLEWAGKENELKDFRDKLVADMAAIDMILNINTSIHAKETRRTQLSKAALTEQNNEQDDCLKSLSFQELDRRQNEVLEAKDGTYEWIWEEQWFCDWAAQSRGIFWIQGKAGSGKSTIMKRILEKLKTGEIGDGVTVVVGYFFNARGANMEKTREGLLRTLLVHILQQNPYLFRHVLPAYRTKRGHQEIVGWDCNVLQKLLLDVLTDPFIGSTILVIDALDECQDDTISQLLEPASAILNLKVCISSRPCTTLLQHLHKSPHKLLLEAGNKAAISLYVSREMKSVRQWNDTRDEEIDELEKRIIKMADGVFLWVELVVRELTTGGGSGDTIMELRKKLSEIPKDLNGLYARMLRKIGEKLRQQAKNMFDWVLFATRPLTIAEFRYALANSSPGEFYSEGEMLIRDEGQMERRLMSRCAGFLEVKKSQNQMIVQLIHQSAKDFLLNFATDEPEISIFVVKTSVAHLVLTRACIRYLSSNEFNRDPLHASTQHECNRNLRLLYHEHTFLEYAGGNWPIHISEAHPEHESRPTHEDELGNCFLSFTRSSRNFAFSFQLFWFQNRQQSFPTRFCPSHVASSFGWVSLINRLASEGILELKSTDKDGRTPLHWSIAYGQMRVLEMAKVLIELGADVSAADEKGVTPLHLAADRGDVSIVKMLLDNKANVNTQTNTADTPLINAAYRGFLDVIELLIGAGADVNQQGQNETALQSAAGGGYQELVAFLLRRGADFTMIGNRLGTALHEAAYHGKHSIVEQLLQAGLDVNTRAGDFDTPLQAAAAGCIDGVNQEGCLKVVILLLDKNADVNIQGGHFGTALQAAARYAYPEMIDLLLNAGADVDIQGGTHGSAIDAAMGFCDDDVIARLRLKASTGLGSRQLASESSKPMLEEESMGSPEHNRNAMFLWWERQKTEVPSYHFLRAVEGGNHNRARILIRGVVDSFKIAITLRRKKALNQLAFIARDGFVKVARLRDEFVLERLITGAIMIMCHAVDKGDKDITEMLAHHWVITFEDAADGDDIEKPITQIVIKLLGIEVKTILNSGKKKDIERLLEAGIELFAVSATLVNPLLPTILREQLVRSWQDAIDGAGDKELEDFAERRAKEYGSTIASGLTDKDEKVLAGTITAFSTAYDEGHRAVAMKLAKALTTGLNTANESNKKLLHKGIRDMKERFVAALQEGSDEKTGGFFKLPMVIILMAKKEKFFDLEETLCWSFVQSIADTGDAGYLAFKTFITSSGKDLLQMRELVNVGESLRKAARILEEKQMVRLLEQELQLDSHEIIRKSDGKIGF